MLSLQLTYYLVALNFYFKIIVSYLFVYVCARPGIHVCSYVPAKVSGQLVGLGSCLNTFAVAVIRQLIEKRVYLELTV